MAAPGARGGGGAQMKIVATMPLRCDGWVCGLTVRAALMWCDAVVALNHGCDTETQVILERISCEYPGRLRILWDENLKWEEMEQRTRMLSEARALGATHVAILDSDEILTGNLIPRMYDACAALIEGWMLELPQINVRGDIDTMHTTGVWAGQHTAVVFKDEPVLSWRPDHKGYQHHHRAPHGRMFRQYRPFQRSDGGLFHLQMLDEKRLRAKQLLYQINDVLGGFRTPEQARQYYSLSVYGCIPAQIPTAEHSWTLRRNMPGLGPIPPTWWEPYRDLLLPHLRPDTEPWQLAECRRLIHSCLIASGQDVTAGLDTFGLNL
jgi:hypothetical protein